MASKFTVSAEFRAEDHASPTIDRVESRFAGLTRFLRERFVVTLADVQRVAVAAFQAIEQAGTLTSQTEALTRNLATQGVAFDAFIEKLRQVSDAQVSTADLVRASSQALLLGIPADRIAELLEVARASAIATGQSIELAFADIVTGIGRASPMILDNLGIVVNLGEVYAEAARQAGTTTEALTQQQKSAALLNGVLETSATRVAQFADAQSQAGAATAKAVAAFEDLSNGLKALATGVVAGAAAAFAAFWQVVAFTTDKVLALNQAVLETLAQLPLVGDSVRTAADGIGSLRERVAEGGAALAEFRETMVDATLEQLGFRDGTAEASEAVAKQTAVIESAGPAVTSYAEELRKVRGELEEVPESADAAADAFDGLTTRTEQNSQAFEAWRDEQRLVREELARTAASAKATQSAFSKNLLGGQSSFAQISGGTFSSSSNPLGKTTSNIPGRVNQV